MALAIASSTASKAWPLCDARGMVVGGGGCGCGCVVVGTDVRHYAGRAQDWNTEQKYRRALKALYIL